MASVWDQWLLRGSRLWEDDISAVHSDSLRVVINFIYLLVCFVVLFHAYLSLAILMASCYEIVCVVVALACYINLCMMVGYGVTYMVGVAYIIGVQGVFFPHISDWGVWVRRHWMLFVAITPLLQSMEGTCHGQVRIVVLVVHLVLSVFAALGICVGYMYVLWCLERTWCCQCLLHLAYVFAICGAWSAPMCWLYVELGVQICVGYMWCGCTYVLAICVVGCLACT